MERTLISQVILVGQEKGLFDITGPGGVDLDTGREHPTTKGADNARMNTATAQGAEGETSYETDEATQLPANKEAPPVKADPNADPQARLARQQAAEVNSLLKRALGDKLSREIDLANLVKATDLDQTAWAIHKKGKAEEVVRQLEMAKKVLPLTERQKESVDKIIENLVTRVALDGGRITVTATARGSTLYQEFQAKKAELEVLEARLTHLTKASFGIASASEKGAVKAIQEAIAQLKRELTLMQPELAEARHQLRSVTAEGRREALEAKIRKMMERSEALQNQERVLRVAQKLQSKIEEVRRRGNLEETNKFFQIIGEARAELKGKSLLEILTNEAGFAPLSEEEVTKLERVFDESFKTATATTARRESRTGETAAPETAAATAGAMGAASTHSGEPVEGVEGAKKVSRNEEAEEFGDIRFGAQSADHDAAQAKAGSWQNLSDGQIAMQIANAGVTMGITASYFQTRSDERRLKRALDRIIAAIEAGNLDAISLALILIARQSKDTLRKAALTVIQSLKYYELQQEVVNKELGKLTGEENNYGSSLQKLTNEMNVFSTNRQAAVSILRDIKSASDELDNIAKSWLDVEGPQERALARWTA